MSIFGWDYPAGCSSVPGDEYGTVDISEKVSKMVGEPCWAYWGEDDALIGCKASDLKSSEDVVPFLKADCEWDDDLSDDDNLNRAAFKVANILKGSA